ncbi:MAG: 5'-nucleotidase C-terminal domain-containing protein, partial [Marinosulfonomonas sp.]|nr:5'-nucleotidase C-terminal domain-containing protein [Marinosulfonomonas sp.]
DQKVAAQTTGVDVIVGGHSNTYLSNTSDRAKGPYPTMVGNTAIVQAYAYGKFLGELNVTFDDAGNLTEAVGEPISMSGEVAEDGGTKSRIAELAIPLEEIRQLVVAQASAAIDGNRDNCRVKECEMGNLVADAMLDRVKDQGVTISIANSGGIRSSIDAGDVTMGEVLSVLPFQNTLATFQIKGSGVIAALENGVSQVEEVKGRFPQVAGIKFIWDMSVAPNEGRIVEVLVADGDAWVPIDPDKVYGVVTNNYVRGGGDGYKMFATDGMNVYDFGPDLADVMAEYMAAKGSYTAYVDGRITQK